jgi:hypothetical protein
LTRGRAATPEPFDLCAVAGTEKLFEALSTRRLSDLSTARADTDDPAATLLAALVADVDAEAPPLPTPTRVPCGMPGTRRRGVRAFVALGVAALVLASAGAAAAGAGGGTGALRTPHTPVRTRGTERSNENAQRQVPVVRSPAVEISPAGRRPPTRHPDAHRVPHGRPKADQRRAPDDPGSGRHGHKPPRVSSPGSPDPHHQTPGPGEQSPPPEGKTQTPTPEALLPSP